MARKKAKKRSPGVSGKGTKSNPYKKTHSSMAVVNQHKSRVKERGGKFSYETMPNGKFRVSWYYS